MSSEVFPEIVAPKRPQLRCRRPWPFRVAEVKREVCAKGVDFGPIFVQVSIAHETVCGRLVATRINGQGHDRFNVDTQVGNQWFGSRHVRRCSGLDGRCVCALEGVRADLCADEGGAQRQRASAVPLGNTGTTTGAGA